MGNLGKGNIVESMACLNVWITNERMVQVDSGELEMSDKRDEIGWVLRDQIT